MASVHPWPSPAASATRGLLADASTGPCQCPFGFGCPGPSLLWLSRMLLSGPPPGLWLGTLLALARTRTVAGIPGQAGDPRRRGCQCCPCHRRWHSGQPCQPEWRCDWGPQRTLAPWPARATGMAAQWQWPLPLSSTLPDTCLRQGRVGMRPRRMDGHAHALCPTLDLKTSQIRQSASPRQT